jgi:hypothetical protein
MNNTDKKLNEMVKNMVLVDELLRELFGDFDMKDILSHNSMKDVPSENTFFMDFKYEGKV